MSCTIKDSVKNFKDDFQKKIVGNSRTVKISNNNTLVTITPRVSSNTVQNRNNAYRMAEKQIAELDKLSKQYLGLKGAFRPGKIEVSPEGVVSYTVRPPFNMYRELLKKQEAIEAAKNREIQESEARVQEMENIKKEVSSILPDTPLRTEIVEGLNEEIQSEKNLFNYSQEVIDEVGQEVFFNSQEFPDDPFSEHDEIQSRRDQEYEDLFHSGSQEIIDEQTKLESMSAYASHLIRAKEKLIENLNKKRRVLIEDANATENFITEDIRTKYLESVNTIDQLIEKSRQDIKTLKRKQEDTMVQVLKDELADLYKDLQGNMEIGHAGDLLSAFANKDIYSRIQLLKKFIPTSVFETSKDYSEEHRDFFETEEYGDYKGALSFAFTGNPKIVEGLRTKLLQIEGLLNTKIDDILLEMVKENPIFLSKMSDIRGEGQKMSLEDFKKIINTELRDLNLFESGLTSMIENDSQMEEYLARAEVAFETRTEHIINSKHAELSQEGYTKAVIAVEAGIAAGKIPKPEDQTAREVLSRMLYDKASFGQKIIDKFTGTYGRLLAEMRDKTKAIRFASGLEAEELYIDKIQSIALEHDLIKPHMLKSIKERIEANPNMQTKLSYFDGVSDQEMQEYEDELRSKLGLDFDRQVDKIFESLVNWEFTENAALTGLTSNSFRRIYEDSPWDFAKNFDKLNEEIELGITTNLYSEYQDEEGQTQKVLNNPSLKNMFLIPKGNPQTNRTHFNQDFESNIGSNSDIYDFWRIAHVYGEYSSSRLGTPFNTITRARKDGTEILAQLTEIRDKFTSGMHVQALKDLFRFIVDGVVREKFSRAGVHYQNSKGVTSHYSNASIQDVNLRTKSLMVKYNYSQLKEKLADEGVKVYINEEDYFKSKREDPAYKIVRTGTDTDESFNLKVLNRDAKIGREYHKVMAKSLASQEVHAKFNTDFLQNLLAQGNMAALQRGNEKSLATAKVLQGFMAQRNKVKSTTKEGNEVKSKRERAESRFNTWIETDIKNNRKGMNKTVVRTPDTGDFELDAELAKDVGNREVTVEASNFLHWSMASTKKFAAHDPTTTAGRMKINALRKYKYYEDAQRDYLNVVNSILEGDLESENFSFRNQEEIDGVIRDVVYSTNYDAEGKPQKIKKFKVKTLNENGSDTISTETVLITEDDFTSGLGLHFASAAARMGREANLAGTLANMGKAFSFASLSFSMVVGVKNRLEGKWAGNIESERFGEGKEFREANHFMQGYNSYRISKNSKVVSKADKAQFKTLDMFVEKLDVFQDKKDFIQRITNQESNVLTNAFAFGIDLPERKNQLPFLLKNASQMFIKGKDGESVAVFGNGEFQIYIPGTLKLKPEFREGPEGKRNIEIWENFGANMRVRGQANPALDLSLKTTADIINSQGNFSDQDTLAVFEHPLGAILLLFNRWFGSRANRMFITKKHLNPITGQQGAEAHMSLSRMGSSFPIAGGYGAVLALQVATPGVAGAAILGGVFAGLIQSSIKSKIRGEGFTPSKEFKLQTAALFTETMSRLITFPFQYFGNSKRLNIVDSEWYNKISPLEKALREDKISPLEAGRIKLAGATLAGSLGMSASFLAMRLALNSTLIDDLISSLTAPEDDDEEWEQRMKKNLRFMMYVMQDKLGNGLENTGNNLQGSAFGEFNLVNFITDRTALPMLGSLQKMQRGVESFGDDGYNDNDAGSLTATFAVLNALGLTTVPSIFGNAINFYKTEGKEGRVGFMQNKVYKPGSWTNKAFIRSQMTSEDVIRNLLNKDGFGLRNKIKKEYVNSVAEEKGIFFRSSNVEFDKAEASADKYGKFLNKKDKETYVEMGERILETLKKDKTVLERSPEYITELEDALKFANKKLETEKEKEEGDYDPSKKYKASKEDVRNFEKHLQDYENKVESKYENRN